MLLEALLALATVVPRLEAGIEATRRDPVPIASATPAGPIPAAGLPAFDATARAVSNWRAETAAALMPNALALVARYAATEPSFVARCVKLNNYWCIKQARWTGELGGDAEGHTGFATAADGADAAALLLRRYYREFGRRSALAIVRRWAPAECGLPGRVATAQPAATGTVRSGKLMLRPHVSTALAPLGLGNTVRARFLARHARGAAPRRVAVRAALPSSAKAAEAGLRVQPWSARARLAGHPRRSARVAASPLPALRPVADIAIGTGPLMPPTGSRALLGAPRAGLAEAGPRMPPTGRAALLPAFRARANDPAALLASDRLLAEAAALPSLTGGGLLDLTVPAPFCASDETRIRAYAGRIADSVGLALEDDLGLFAADGTPTARLAPVMRAMSQVELGALHAGPALIAAAIERLALRVSAADAAAASATIR